MHPRSPLPVCEKQPHSLFVGRDIRVDDQLCASRIALIAKANCTEVMPADKGYLSFALSVRNGDHRAVSDHYQSSAYRTVRLHQHQLW